MLCQGTHPSIQVLVSLPQAAAALAAGADLESVETLLQHHPYTLMPHLLDILASVPETVPPGDYLHLLPKVHHGSPD